MFSLFPLPIVASRQLFYLQNNEVDIYTSPNKPKGTNVKKKPPLKHKRKMNIFFCRRGDRRSKKKYVRLKEEPEKNLHHPLPQPKSKIHNPQNPTFRHFKRLIIQDRGRNLLEIFIKTDTITLINFIIRGLFFLSCRSHDASFLVIANALLEEVSLSSERDGLHEIEGIC